MLTNGYQIQLSQIIYTLIYTLSSVTSLFLRFLGSVKITVKRLTELSQFLEQLKPKLLLPLLYLENSSMC